MSGEEFEELVVPMFDEDWDKRREGDEFAPSLGKVPILWDGDCVVWDSLAIIEFLADRVGTRPLLARGRSRARHGPVDGRRNALRLRQPAPRAADERPQDLRRSSRSPTRSQPRSTGSCSSGRRPARASAGPANILFGDWCAVDIMFAPVVTRFVTYRCPVPPFAAAYMEAVLSHRRCRRMDRHRPRTSPG